MKTVREYFESAATNSDDSVMIDGWDGWEIERSKYGLTVCSPRTSASEIARDDSEALLVVTDDSIEILWPGNEKAVFTR